MFIFAKEINWVWLAGLRLGVPLLDKGKHPFVKNRQIDYGIFLLLTLQDHSMITSLKETMRKKIRKLCRRGFTDKKIILKEVPGHTSFLELNKPVQLATQ